MNPSLQAGIADSFFRIPRTMIKLQKKKLSDEFPFYSSLQKSPDK
jgi:hypothetical protein